MQGRMFAWPAFSAHLHRGGPPAQRVAALLADLAAAEPRTAEDVLGAAFADAALVAAVGGLARRRHHVGFLAPSGLDVGAVERVLAASPFRREVRAYASTVLVRELSARLGRPVEVAIVHAYSERGPSAGGVEVFVANLASACLDDLVAAEFGCHVALEVDSAGALDDLRRRLHAHGCAENPLMRHGALRNGAMHSAVLYVDTAPGARPRRIEFIACGERDTAAAPTQLRCAPARG
jgi:hypothetical protein